MKSGLNRGLESSKQDFGSVDILVHSLAKGLIMAMKSNGENRHTGVIASGIATNSTARAVERTGTGAIANGIVDNENVDLYMEERI
ncbi:hypothetical protein Tco_0708874 [Tanacetum coccineum]